MIPKPSEGLLLYIRIMCVHVYLCESNYADGKTLCFVTFCPPATCRPPAWQKKDSRAVKGMRFFFCTYTQAHRDTVHTKIHTHAGKSIHADIHKGLAEWRVGDFFIWASQSRDNCFEIKYLLYLNAN